MTSPHAARTRRSRPAGLPPLHATPAPMNYGRTMTGNDLLRYLNVHWVIKRNVIPSHRLQFYQMLVLEKGACTLVSDGVPVELHGNSFVLNQKGRTLSSSGSSANRGLFYWIGFDLDREACQPLPEGYAPVLRELWRRHGDVAHQASDDLLEAVHRYHRLVGAGGRNRLVLLGAALHLLGVLVENLGAQPAASPPIPDALVPALELMRQGSHSALSVEELAAACRLSLSAFTKLFRRATGLTPRDYINEHKMEQARALLSGGGMLIKEVARTLGFSSPEYFVNVFRRFHAVSPSGYRRRLDAGGSGGPPAAADGRA